MKLIYILSLLTSLFIFAGCASDGGAETATSEEATSTGDSSYDGAGAKTAYEGSTGSGLLMERYKSGQIEGFRE